MPPTSLGKPLDWPRYMVVRRLRNGDLAYYWTPRRNDLGDGVTIQGEALGCSYGDAIERAGALNLQLDAWRHGRGETKNLDTGPRFGTVAWLFERYRRSVAFARVGTRSQPEYLRALKRIEDLPTKTGGQVRDLLVSSITARAAERPKGQARASGEPVDRHWATGVENRAEAPSECCRDRESLRGRPQEWR
jgi:hypothetical protein